MNSSISNLEPTAPNQEKQEQRSEASMNHMTDEFEKMKMPSDEATELEPSRGFPTMPIPHMCSECIRANKTAKIIKDENGQELYLTVCKICWDNDTGEQRPKFYNHDMLCFIRGLEGQED